MNNKPIGGRRRRRKSDKPNPIDVHVGTRVRLRELFGHAAELNLRDGNGVTVEIAIPFRTLT